MFALLGDKYDFSKGVRITPILQAAFVYYDCYRPHRFFFFALSGQCSLFIMPKAAVTFEVAPCVT